MLSNPGGSVQWPKERYAHSSVLINNSTGPHLLVVGGWVPVILGYLILIKEYGKNW